MAQQTFEFKEENHFGGFINTSKDIKLNIGGQTKQTAVEWFIEQIKNEQQNQESLSTKEWMQVIQQAKQMEKEQIINAVYNTMEFNPNVEAAEKYYNKTYGK